MFGYSRATIKRKAEKRGLDPAGYLIQLNKRGTKKLSEMLEWYRG